MATSRKPKTEKPLVDKTVLTLEAEEITGDDQLIKQIDTALTKANVTDRIIGELKQKYGNMQLKSLDDQEGYLLIKEARKEVRGYGILTEKICEKGREEAVRTQKLWLDSQKKTLAKINEVQAPLDAEIKKYEEEEARREKARKDAMEEQFILRQQELTRMGVLFAGGMFVLSHEQFGGCEFSVQEVKEAEETTWKSIILLSFKEIHDKIEAARIAEDNRKKEEDEKRKRDQEELDKQRAAQEKERNEFLNERFEVRQHHLEKLGLSLENGIFHYSDKIRITSGEIRMMEVPAYNELRSGYKVTIAEIKQQEQKEQEQRELVQSRLAMLSDVSWNGHHATYKKKSEEGGIVAAELQNILEFNDAEWKKLVDSFNEVVRKDIAKRDEQIAEDAREKERVKLSGESRFRMMESIDIRSLTVEYLGGLTEEEWRKLYAEQEKSFNDKKQEEQNKSSDKDKWTFLLNQFNAIEFPDMKSAAYKKKVESAKRIIAQVSEI
jgi:hypothetical protein